MLLLYFTDSHIYGKNPIGRTDNLTITQFFKIEEVVKLAQEYDCPVLCSGDLTHSPNIGYSLYIILLSFLKDLPHGLFLIAGQHDLWYHDIKSISNTALGALVNSGYNIKLIDDFNKKYYPFTFDYCHWGEEIVQTDSTFLITHKPVVPRKWVEKFHFLKHNQNNDKYFLLEELENYKLILCGDWHNQYIYEGKNTLIINPGALVRREITEENKNNLPSVVLIETDTLEYEIIPLSVAKPAKEVFTEKHLELIRAYKDISIDVTKFLNTLKISDNKHSHFLNRLVDLINSKQVEDDVCKKIKYILHRIYGSQIDYQNHITMRKQLRKK